MTPRRAIRWPRCDGRTRRCGRWWANSVARGSGSGDPPCSVCFGRGATRCASTRSASAGHTRPSATPSSVGSMPGGGTSCTPAGRCSASTPRRRSPSASSRTPGGGTDAILERRPPFRGPVLPTALTRCPSARSWRAPSRRPSPPATLTRYRASWPRVARPLTARPISSACPHPSAFRGTEPRRGPACARSRAGRRTTAQRCRARTAAIRRSAPAESATTRSAYSAVG